ncbi:MAG: DUF2225 domain-containing protein [Spirochaetes bacterium]|jgi:hypothetical protein|nr:DUF2225 domain-containing protein [Spirochaetota bacterium]
METAKKISFRQKNVTVCPICSYEFHREELLSGGGRLIAGKLTDELRRLYEESKKFGNLNPLYYYLTVCPKCFYSAFPRDFDAIEPSEAEKIRELTSARKGAVQKFFGSINFNDERNLELGAASYMLSVDCYGYRNKKVAPTFKKALSSIRAAWLFSDLGKAYPDKPYRQISQFFYKKAYQYYIVVLDLIQTGAEPVEAMGSLGPDADKNWGYDGILYISAILTVKIGSKDPDVKKRVENLEKCKRYLSKVFGIGKTSKSRPSDLLDKIKDLYDKINKMIEEWGQETAEIKEE